MRARALWGGVGAVVAMLVAAGVTPGVTPLVGVAPVAFTQAPDGINIDDPVGPGVTAAAGSILRVGACKATTCDRYDDDETGSGWVVAHERVVTNAHVMAGSRSARVQVGEGPSLPGRVVVFDPSKDLAVLAVPGLTAPPLKLGADLKAGDPAVIAGHPGGLQYVALPARVLSHGPITINDAYADGPGRDSYALLGYAAEGSSGGPLLAPDGSVVGVVYAGDGNVNVDALTLTLARPVLDAAVWSINPVDTGKR